MRFIPFLTLLLVPALAAAQARDLVQLRDSLARRSDVPALRELAKTLARGPQAREPDALMERGLVLLRLFELTGRNGDGDDARAAFEKVIEREPRNGWAHYGLGLALAGGPGVRVPTPGGVLDGFVLGQSLAEIVKQDPKSRAARAFIKALEIDPALAPAAIELANLALESRHQKTLERSRAALQTLIEQGNTEADVRVALSQVQSALGDVAAAAHTVSDDASADGLLARAEALLRQPGSADAGAEAYFAAINELDERSAQRAFEQVRIIATDRELSQWEPADLEGRRALLTRFWDLRAATSGKTVAERIAEHYTRLATAQERFRRLGKRGGAPHGSLVQEKFDPDQLPFDERGLIYVRHGEPLEVIRTSNSDLRPNESWVYQGPDGKNRLYHFVVLRDGTDYRLVDDVLNAMDPSANELPYDAVISLLESRGAYDARYTLLANRFDRIRYYKRAGGAAAAIGAGNVGDANDMLSMIATTRLKLANETREATLAALETDTDRPQFTAELPFYYDVYSFKGQNRGTDLTAAIAIPGTALEPRSTPEGLVYSLQLSLIVIDTARGQVSRRDTIYNLRSDRRLAEGEHLRVHTDLASNASNTSIHRLVIRDLGRPGHGQMYGGETMVPSYPAATLLMSDIVLAEPDAGAWHRGDAHLALVPPRQFLEGEPLTLFYELYNLREGARYRTEINLAPTEGPNGLGRLKKLFGGGGGAVRLQFDGEARPDAAGNVQEIRRVSTQMKPGRYEVTVQVTNLENRQVTTNEKQFVVIERKKK